MKPPLIQEMEVPATDLLPTDEPVVTVVESGDLNFPVGMKLSLSAANEYVRQMDAYRALIHENISYGDLLRDHPYDADLIDGYVELMVEVCCTQRETVRVNQEDLPAGVVRSRFLELNREHILYVMEAMQRNTKQVANIRGYILSALYNAPVTIGQYYTSQVSHDLAQDWRAGT